MKFKNFIQYDIMDCGPTCLKMIAHHYGKTIRLETLRAKTKKSRQGVSLNSISAAAEEIGFISTGAIVSFEQLLDEVMVPVIAHWRQNHFVVVYKVTKKNVYVSDPAQGNKVYSKNEFVKFWSSMKNEDEPMGIVMILEPSDRFYELENETDNSSKIGFKYLLRYLFRYKRELKYVLLAIALSSVLQFIFPFLTQLIVDSGINEKSVSTVAIILMAQFALLLGRLVIEYIRSWFLLFINSRINVSILSDFLMKLLRLPLSYFDTKMTGDIMQRINDHRRIQEFLTGPALEMLFSLATIVVLGATLFIYNKTIFLVFLAASVLYSYWTVSLLKRRSRLDHKRFELGAQNHSETLQIINGIQEIRLNNGERRKRWNWEKVQAKLFRLNIDSLKYNQVQQSGAFLINEGKNLMITFIAASAVINGQFTLGMMLAIQAVVGQLNGPITLMINLIQNLHDTKLSLQRMTEVHNVRDEEPLDQDFITEYPNSSSLRLTNISFAYPGTDENVLKALNLRIPEGKTTAIVGSSGSGKTTLLKLLLKFYDGYEGDIQLGNTSLKEVSPRFWRSRCGTVLQDAFIFSDTIANNICISEDEIDQERLNYAIHIANIQEFINSLPLREHTKIGAEGMGISQGQKQRILIARAVYKNPDFIFLDEATNALDANNESVIIRNLEEFFHGKTVVVVAHRLSTVRNADQIIVMDKGCIVEYGQHEDLVKSRKNYYTLVKNQLELGN
jgi:ATP-binding cassette subfamily B protein